MLCKHFPLLPIYLFYRIQIDIEIHRSKVTYLYIDPYRVFSFNLQHGKLTRDFFFFSGPQKSPQDRKSDSFLPQNFLQDLQLGCQGFNLLFMQTLFQSRLSMTAKSTSQLLIYDLLDLIVLLYIDFVTKSTLYLFLSPQDMIFFFIVNYTCFMAFAGASFS